MIRTVLGLAALAIAAMLAIPGCATTALPTQLVLAKQGEDIVIRNTDASLKAGLINATQAESVSNIAHQVDPLMETAQAAIVAGDTVGATKTLQLINALLAGLQTFLPPPTPAVTSGAPAP